MTKTIFEVGDYVRIGKEVYKVLDRFYEGMAISNADIVDYTYADLLSDKIAYILGNSPKRLTKKQLLVVKCIYD